MLTLSQTLSYYKRKDIQKLILMHAEDKEIGTRFLNESFGKRPDALRYDNDILELAKKGVSSFHCSEELWNNPLQLNPNMRRNDLDDLRKGWDLILDIDCPYWALSKLITYTFIKALKDHGIQSVTVKFSGSKGFHIAVPFEAFPETINIFDDKDQKIKSVSVKNLFPEGPRRIAEYLLHYVEKNLISANNDTKKITFGKASLSYDTFMELTGKLDVFINVCKKCGKQINNIKQQKIEFVCPYCETIVNGNADANFMQCPKCKKLMEKKSRATSLCSCGSNEYIARMDLHKIVDIDTILISSRHLYRMPYSLHEKTGFVSMPIDTKYILKFEKEDAKTTLVKAGTFLDRTTATLGEANMLFQKAFDYTGAQQRKETSLKDGKMNKSLEKTYTNTNEIAQAIPEEYFPPCIKKISQGLEDGKKRALFILINFLSSCGWEYEKIEEYILKWNERNAPDKLRETYLRGQLRYYKMQKTKLPPPNCDNRGYMIDTGFCNPDGLCKTIKNPAQYAKKKIFLVQKYGKKEKKNKS
jgi:hypothetical protein